MRDLPGRAQAYLISMYGVGLVAAGWLVLGKDEPIGLQDVLLAIAIAIVASITQVMIVLRAGNNYSDHLTPAPLFAAFLLLPSPLLLAVIIFAFLPEWIVYRRKWFIQLFNIVSWVVAVTASRYALMQFTEAYHLRTGDLLSLPDVLLALTVILLTQTGMLAFALKFARGHSLRESGLFAPEKLFVDTSIFCLGWIFAFAWIIEPGYGIAALLPMALVFQALHIPNLRVEATTDPKTGLANMRHFNAVLRKEIERAERNRQQFSLLMCDLDFLRDINNNYGHPAGDVVLLGIASIIRQSIRGYDIAGRFGGEEFLVLLADTDSATAFQVAERIRMQTQQSRFTVDTSPEPIGATMSIGIATFPTNGQTVESLMHNADLAVYQAKRSGRNRVVLASDLTSAVAAEWAQETVKAKQRLAEEEQSVKPPETPLQSTIRTLDESIQRIRASDRVRRWYGRLADGSQTGLESSAQARTGPPPLLIGCIGLIVMAAAAGVLSGLYLTDIPWNALAFFGLMTVIAQYLAVDVDQRGKTSVSVVPTLAASILFGAWGALTTGTVFAVLSKLKANSPIHRMMFNFGTIVISALVAAWTFGFLVGQPVSQTTFDRMFIPAIIAGLVNYAVNHALLSLVRGISEHTSPIAIWMKYYQWLLPHYAVLGILALIVAIGYETFGWTGVVALVAPVGMMHLAIRQYMERTNVHMDELRRINTQLSDSYEATLQALTRALDTRDEETEEHSRRVRRYTEMIAGVLGVPREEVEHISRGALLHDIGKIGVPDAILLKPGRLSPDERAIMMRHPIVGYGMISHIPFLEKAAPVVLHHHEAYDGSGYPSGLRGEEIPIGARIFAVADSLDAMTSDRPYRKAMLFHQAIDEIIRCSGSQFDPRVVSALLTIPTETIIHARDGITRPEREGPTPVQLHPLAS